jgi:anti-sigma B factor antagonist
LRQERTEGHVEIIKKELKPGVVVLELKGPLQMGVECKQLELAFDELLREKKTRVVLDFTGITKFDSGGLGKLVNCFSRLKKAGGAMRLAGVRGMSENVLKLTLVDRLMKVYPTALEASENFTDAS